MGAPCREYSPTPKTRSGQSYSLSRVILTPITCNSNFAIAPLLQAALDEELDALPDVPYASDWGYFNVLEAPSAHRDTPVPEHICFVPDRPSGLFLPQGATPPIPDVRVRLCKRNTRDFDFEDTSEDGPSSTPPNKRPRASAEPPSLAAGSSSSEIAHRPHLSTTHGNNGRSARTLRNKGRKKAHQAKRKDERFLESGQVRRPEVARKIIEGCAIIPARVNPHTLPANSSGYEALAKNSGTRKVLELQGLLDDGFRLIQWDGTDSKLLSDPKTKKLFAFCVGKPNDPTYDAACAAAADLIHDCGCMESFSSKEKDHKRGKNWAALNMGIFYGHGPPKPYNLCTKGHDALAKILLDNQHINRLAAMQSTALRLYAPKLYHYNHVRFASVLQHFPNLRQNFARSVYSAAAFNFGPHVVTFPHRDAMNLAFGLCAIHALGDFDHTKGGHMVLVEAKLVIEFPPGALILLPSATITHANTPVSAHETRVSFTQYTPGALFRYVDNGFRTQEKYAEEDPEGFETMLAEKALRWEMGIGLWSTLDELLHRSD